MAPRLPHGEPQHTVTAPERGGGDSELAADRRHRRPERLHGSQPLPGDEAVHHPGEGDTAAPGEGSPHEKVRTGRRQREAEARPRPSYEVGDLKG